MKNKLKKTQATTRNLLGKVVFCQPLKISGSWHIQYKASNGKILASSETFRSFRAALRNAESVRSIFQTGTNLSVNYEIRRGDKKVKSGICYVFNSDAISLKP
jgi:uncharacterized protein YegP (UPF0339 family)